MEVGDISPILFRIDDRGEKIFVRSLPTGGSWIKKMQTYVNGHSEFISFLIIHVRICYYVFIRM